MAEIQSAKDLVWEIRGVRIHPSGQTDFWGVPYEKSVDLIVADRKAIVERIREQVKGTIFEHSLDLVFDDVLREIGGEQ